MKLEQINIRDPYILKAEGKYYLYGTRSSTTWTHGDGFDCYVSPDLAEWEGPIEIFHRPDGFFADKEYWAPECFFLDGCYYLIATFGSDDRLKGIYSLRSESPAGPFEVCSGRLTPDDWICLDGTVYVEDGTPYLVFSHSFEDGSKGCMSCVALSRDLKSSVGEPFELFDTTDVPWAVPFPFAKEEFGVEGDAYFTDGPCLRKMEDGRLYMTWSSWSGGGYAVGVAVSESGKLRGPWKHANEALFPENGGHGMFFTDYAGKIYFTLHYPNDRLKEHPVLYPVEFKDGNMRLADTGSGRTGNV